ncbi:MAG TPA: hypothetical protein VMZ92_08915, partial [Planctomycetota bacterium]|nr:hypothetical protein [Planctomycetota bacterium]
SLWGDIAFTPPGGGFAFLLGLAGLGASPLVGRLLDFGQFQSFLVWRRHFHPRHTILSPEEVSRAWRELREYRWPTFFLPAVA